MADSTESTKAQRVHLDLDSLDRNQVQGVQEKRDKFAVTFAGKRIEFEDPAELPYDVLLVMDTHPSRFFKATLTPDDHKHFLLHSKALKGYMLRKLMQDYQDYYGIDSLGNVAGSQR